MAFDHSDMYDALADKALHGETIIYTPPGGTAITLDAIWAETPPEPREADDGEHDEQTATVLLNATDLTVAIRNAAVTRALTGETWTVQYPPRLIPGNRWQCRLRRTQTTEKTAGKYRRL